ncbi:MAG TPA: SusD/RagB family nutrient-binding outer membrane lipoprotein [Longimicrobiaceae bacterium]|nr:SusD/RagB family nutrient-binding outer membrane lipoprotein [Longimicrobiaceae bacterium]
MKLLRLSRKLSVVALAVAVGACDEGLTDLNQNPNAPTDVPADLILRNAVQSVANTALGVGMSWNHAGLWAQHVAQIQYAEEDRYQPRVDNIQAFWDALYVAPAKDFDVVASKSRAANRPLQEGVGLVMKSWTFGVMTDLWGDIPYTEALQGDASGNFTPKYSTQQEVYNGLFTDLRRADQLLAPGGATGFGAADLIYNGDGTRWRRFANSLRLRNAMHLTKVDAAKARSEFEAAIANPVLSSNADNAVLRYTGAAPNQNPFFVNVLSRDDHRISKTMVDMLRNLNDPRLPVYAQPAQSNGQYVGYGNGLPNNSMLLADASKIGSAFLAANAPAYFMTAAEVFFLRAEAAQRGWNAGGGTAAQHYAAGIRAAMEMYGISSSAIDAYLAQPSVQYDPARGFQQIATQKWIALYLQGYEAWTEWRRTGFPQIAPGPAARGPVPRRLPYPGLEVSLNKANLDAAIARQGDTGLAGRVWWDRP